MVDARIQRLKAQYQADLRQARFLPETKARTGQLASTSAVAADPKVYDVNGALITNKIWVRIGATKTDKAGRSTVPVWNYDKVATDKADLAVILVEDQNGDLYVDRADNTAADAYGVPSGFYGDSASRPPETSRTVIPLANIFDLMPYRDSAGVLRARAGWLPNGAYWYDDADDYLTVTDYVTATIGQRAYVVAGIDLETNLWIADTSIDRGILLPPGSYTDIEPIIAARGNVFSIAAIPMANGATDFANADIIDLRTWGSGSGGLDVVYSADDVSNPPTQEQLATAFGNPWDVGRRFLGILDDGGAGTKPYAILSDGAQFLGLPFTTFRSGMATATWTRHETVLAPSGGSETLMAEPCVLYDTDPVIHTDMPRVFKMWVRGGTGVTASGFAIYYAESPDGIAWTRLETPILSAGFSPHIVKAGSTYYLYVVGGLYARIDLYTSIDGVNFTLHTASVIATGSGWESANVANPFVWTEDGGTTFKMLYEARGSNWAVGLATSSDGISWTKSGSNPVLSAPATRGGPQVHKVGSTYYYYGQCSVGPGVLPTDIWRFQSTDLITWTNGGVFLARLTADEGPSPSVVGQVGDPTLVIVNGVAYFFYAATIDGFDDDGSIKLLTGSPSLLTA